MIEGVRYEVGAEAVVVEFRDALPVVSSALVGGGLTTARAIINLHVPKSLEDRSAHSARWSRTPPIERSATECALG